MSATALTVRETMLPASFEQLAGFLRVENYPAPRVIDQEPGPLSQYSLALLHLSFAAVLLCHALRVTPASINAWACRRLARIPTTVLLAFSASGLVGWAAALCLTVMFIWR